MLKDCRTLIQANISNLIQAFRLLVPICTVRQRLFSCIHEMPVFYISENRRQLTSRVLLVVTVSVRGCDAM